jgi:hypothetical protein
VLSGAGARADDRGGEEEVLHDIPDQAAPSQAAAPVPASRSRLQAKDLHPILVKGDLRRFQTPPADSLPRSGSQSFHARWDESGATDAAPSRCDSSSVPLVAFKRSV